jgi:hypothetical protein
VLCEDEPTLVHIRRYLTHAEAIMQRRAFLRRLSTRTILSATLTLATLMLGASPTLAQDTASTTSAELAPDLGLRPGAVVRLATPSVGQLEANLVRAMGPELVLSSNGSERTLHLGAGDSLWVLGHSARQGAKAGGVVGLVLTGAAVALFYSICRDGSDDPCTGQAGFIPMGLVLTGTGALIGASIGRSMPRWDLRWP